MDLTKDNMHNQKPWGDYSQVVCEYDIVKRTSTKNNNKWSI